MKKILYFLPLIIACLFYGAVIVSGFAAINPNVWIAIIVLFISSILMTMNKWWGSIFGIAVGILLIYMGTRETGQIINELPIGILMCLYYVICGVYIYKKVNRIQIK